MNNVHNPNHYASRERSVVEIRREDLALAFDNANRSATNKLGDIPTITVHEVPAPSVVSVVPHVGTKTDIEAESRRLVEAAYAPVTDSTQDMQPEVAPVVEIPARPVQRQSESPLDEIYGRLAGFDNAA